MKRDTIFLPTSTSENNACRQAGAIVKHQQEILDVDVDKGDVHNDDDFDTDEEDNNKEDDGEENDEQINLIRRGSVEVAVLSLLWKGGGILIIFKIN